MKRVPYEEMVAQFARVLEKKDRKSTRLNSSHIL